jgi:c-di-GMP-binding flagellar brake protein YcgR
MFLDTQPMDLSGDDELAEFRVPSRAEAQALLRRLIDGNEPVNLNAPDGTSYTTTLWTLDAARGKLTFAADVNEPRLQRLLDANRTTVVAYLESVKLQFDVNHLMLVHAANASALQAELPQQMYRFQRRRSFRVRPLARTSPVARLRHPMLPEMTLELRLLDVSIGGCALFLPQDVPPLEPGVLINQVRVEIDGDTRFDAALRLQHVSVLNADSGGARLGCEFVNLGGSAERALQRFIDNTQKRRRLLSLE